MRENNSCNIFLQQATYLISLNNYDKRALTVTDPGPLTHSLLNLAYLSASSPQKISNLLSGDGGLLILIKKLNHTKEKLPFSAILAILSNLIIRGNSGFRFLCFNYNILNPLFKLLKDSLSLLNSQSSPMERNEENSAFERLGESSGIVPITGPLTENIVGEDLVVNNRENTITDMMGKFDDVVLAIKIICYLSKYQGKTL